MAILRTLRTFSSGMASFSESSSGVGSRPISCSIWRRGAHDLVDRLDHVHGDADGARLVGDRAGDRLPDPPRGVGRELVAAAVLELVDRLHQADVAFLDQVQELQAAVGVLLGDGDDEAQVGLHHLLLGLARLALALLHGLDDAAELGDLEARLGGQRVDVVADARRCACFSCLMNWTHFLLPHVAMRSSQVWSSSLPKYSSMNCWRGTP